MIIYHYWYKLAIFTSYNKDEQLWQLLDLRR